MQLSLIMSVTMLTGLLFSSAVYASITKVLVIQSSGEIASLIPHIKVIGNKTFTASGTQIVLKGFCYTYFVNNGENCYEGTWLLPDGSVLYNTWSTSGVQYNLDFMKASGANVVRVFMTAEFWIKNTGGFRDHIKYFVTEAAKRGIYTILTFWNTENGREMPTSTTPWEDGNSLITTIGDFVNLWENVGQSLKYYPSVLFELWNEPQGDEEDWFLAVQQCINRIRSIGANQPIIVQYSYQINYDFGSGWYYGMDWVFDYPLSDTAGNLIYSTHIYSSTWHGFYNSTSGKMVTDYDAISQALKKCKVYDVAAVYPVFIGEIGCSNWDLDNQLVYYNNTLTLLDQHGIGYAAFAAPPWHSATQWGLVQFGAANYALTASGQILVSHLGGVKYSDWIGG
ncbi:MAG: cellulase family glycosylhydrolase [Candidatus Bathyarchaeia archaeon]